MWHFEIMYSAIIYVHTVYTSIHHNKTARLYVCMSLVFYLYHELHCCSVKALFIGCVGCTIKRSIPVQSYIFFVIYVLLPVIHIKCGVQLRMGGGGGYAG